MRRWSGTPGHFPGLDSARPLDPPMSVAPRYIPTHRRPYPGQVYGESATPWTPPIPDRVLLGWLDYQCAREHRDCNCVWMLKLFLREAGLEE